MLAWPKLLFVYGPFALLVFVVIILESKARKAWHSDRDKISGAILTLTWLVIFSLCGVVVYAWFLFNTPPFVLRGSVQDLRGEESIGSKDFYSLSDYYDKNRNIFNVNFALVTSTLSPQGQTLTFRFFRTPNEDGVPYELTISPELYRTNIVVRAVDDAGGRKLRLPSDTKGA